MDHDLKEIADRVFATPGRAKSGVCGQTIEAMQRNTFHQISAYDADALYEADAEITRLRDALAAMTAERDAFAASRIGYASEFPLDENGEPDVGNIHANIRLLKLERDAAYAKGLEDAAQVADGAPDWTDHACDIAAAIRAMKGDKT